MIVPKSLCLYFYLALLVGTWVVLFVRALARRKLISQVAPFFQQSQVSAEWAAAHHWLWRILGDARRMRFFRQHIDLVPAELVPGYRQFVLLHRLGLALVALLILLALFANKVCG